MPNDAVCITLAVVPDQDFHVRVREPKANKKYPDRLCPAGSTPAWVKRLVKRGQDLSLPPLIDHAGSHFLDCITDSALKAGSTPQIEAATALAWAIISMVKPTVRQKQLWVEDPGDGDIKRLCSELLGVGAGLHLLTAAKVIDFRTINKLGDDFDYEAFSPDGKRILIEAKGTFNGVSLNPHRKSFAKKLKNNGFLKPGASRGYSSAVGIVFATWSTAKRGFDVELLDPEHSGEVFREDYIRSVIRYYARRFGEDLQNEVGARRLDDLSKSSNLFSKEEPLLHQLGSDKHESRAFYRVVIRLRRGTVIQEFLGSFWESRAVAPPYRLGSRRDTALPIAFIGFDREILRFIRERRFDELLEYRGGTETQFVFDDGGVQGQFSLDESGILRGWMTSIPSPDTVFEAPHPVDKKRQAASE
jgi:hypothetical protein